MLAKKPRLNFVNGFRANDILKSNKKAIRFGRWLSIIN
jgi:hypothetical protein